MTSAIHFGTPLTPPMVAHQLPYPRWQANQVTRTAMSPTLARQPRNPR